MALRDTLAELVPEAKDLRTLLIEAGIPVESVTLTGSGVSNWQSALTVAEALGRWPHLIVRVLYRFPEHTLLWRALGERAGIAMPPQVATVRAPKEEKTTEDEPPMPLDERDRADIRRLSDEMHKMRGILTQMNLDNAVLRERRTAWEESTTRWQEGQDKRLETIENLQKTTASDVGTLKLDVGTLKYPNRPQEGVAWETLRLLLVVAVAVVIAVIAAALIVPVLPR